MRFRATLELNGRTATGIEVPPDVVEALGGGRRPAVTVAIGDHTYRTTIGAMDGRALIPVSAENRARAGIAAGDVVDVEIERDDAPRELEVPGDLSQALDAEPGARAAFDALSFSGKRRYVDPVVQAKAPETRERRIAKAVADLTSR
ncbi:YdeI/OmpD-associated family protein [Luteimicrobium sp. NPDC057192]|uniref:YdeI/OmpD-associated family protein n=1 Tax=Luteimicrobium sp. NPDC057192 TaxID=3346042 RepID=UPI00363195DE